MQVRLAQYGRLTHQGWASFRTRMGGSAAMVHVHNLPPITGL
jgi:hypothetical protein